LNHKSSHKATSWFLASRLYRKNGDNILDSPWDWPDNPSRLVTWMEILEFGAAAFVELSNLLGRLDELFDAAASQSNAIRDDTLKRMKNAEWNQVRETCNSIGLAMSVKSVDRVVETLRSENLSIGQVRAAYAEMHNRIVDELESKLFLYIPEANVELYHAGKLFGAQVEEAFPSTLYDIKEAGKCLALGRNTACVFHLMRVVGAGVTALGKSLNEPTLDASHNLTWDNVLRRCGKEVGATFDKMSPTWQADKQFYAEATARLFAVKDAWRNPNAHEIGAKYTDEEASDIYRTVRSFMRQLATKLKE
jgi:hypothetical protein